MKTVQLLSVLNVVVNEEDTRANLVKRTILSIVRTALAVADVATRRAVMVEVAGAITNLTQRTATLPQLKVRLLPAR